MPPSFEDARHPLRALVRTLVASCALGLALAQSACAPRPIVWGRVAHLRAYGPAGRVSAVHPREREAGEIGPKRHYASLAIESVFLRNLYGRMAGLVSLDLYLSGAGPRHARVFLGVSAVSGPQGFVRFDAPLRVAPFLFEGWRRLELKAYVYSAYPEVVPQLRAAVASRGRPARAIDLYDRDAMGVERKLVERPLCVRPDPWHTSLVLNPDAPRLERGPLVAGRHVYFMESDTHGPAAQALVGKLRWADGRLVWRADGRLFTELPHVVVKVDRYKRYPLAGTKLGGLIAQMRAALSRGDADAARTLGAQVRQAIHADTILTQREKNWEHAWLGVRLARAEQLEAQQRGDAAATVAAIDRQLRARLGLARAYRELFEVEDHLAMAVGLDALVAARDGAATPLRRAGAAVPSFEIEAIARARDAAREAARQERALWDEVHGAR